MAGAMSPAKSLASMVAPCTFCLTERHATEGVLRAFRRMEDLWQYLSEQRRSRTSASGQEGVALVNPGDPAYFYEHVNYAGAQLSVSVGHALSDLRKVSFFPWWWINWNDQISSLKPAPPLVFTPDSSDDPLTVMYEHIDFDGSSLAFSYIPGDISSLVPYGWNDRVSSIAIVAPSS